MKRPPAHLVSEWERWPDLFIVQPTNICMAREMAEQLCRGHCPTPFITVSTREGEVSTCEDTVKQRRCTIVMRQGYTVGELCHELAHAHLFASIGDHGHTRPIERATIQDDASVRHVPVFERRMDMIAAGAMCFECGDWLADALLDTRTRGA